eukprot:GEMP01002816.1.p1 GENE.GEMP01002816.1~~GEMP01002816.1.p1  ORF type:complete len:855 (+),score=160.68 GEMP01002816.1:141-2567(+)
MLSAGNSTASTPDAGATATVGVRNKPMTSADGSTFPQKSVGTAVVTDSYNVTTDGDLGAARCSCDEDSGPSDEVPNEKPVALSPLELVAAFFGECAREKEGMPLSPKSAQSFSDRATGAPREKKNSSEAQAGAKQRARSTDDRSEVWDRLATRNASRRTSRAFEELEAAKVAKEAEIKLAQNLHHGRKLTEGRLDRLFRDHEAKERRRYRRFQDSLNGFFQPTISSNPNPSGLSTKPIPVFTRLYTPHPRRTPSPPADHEDSKKPSGGVAAGIRLHNEAVRRQHEKKQQEEESDKKTFAKSRQASRSVSQGPRQNTSQTAPDRPSLLQLIENMRKRVKEITPAAAKEGKNSTTSLAEESLESLPHSPHNVIPAVAPCHSSDVARNSDSSINHDVDHTIRGQRPTADPEKMRATTRSEEFAAAHPEHSAGTHPGRVYVTSHPEDFAAIRPKHSAITDPKHSPKILPENFSGTPPGEIPATQPENFSGTSSEESQATRQKDFPGTVSEDFPTAYAENFSETLSPDFPATPSELFPTTDSSATPTSPLSPYVVFSNRARPQCVPKLILPQSHVEENPSILAPRVVDANAVCLPPAVDVVAAPPWSQQGRLETRLPDPTLTMSADAVLDPVHKTASNRFMCGTAPPGSVHAKSHITSRAAIGAFNAPTPTRLAAKPLQRTSSMTSLCIFSNNQPLAPTATIHRSSSGSIINGNVSISRQITPVETRLPASYTSVVSTSQGAIVTPLVSSSQLSVDAPLPGASMVFGKVATTVVSGPVPQNPARRVLHNYIPPRTVSPWPRENVAVQTSDGSR